MNFFSRFAAASLVVSGLFIALSPAQAQNTPMPGAPMGKPMAAPQDPLLKGITLDATQQTKYKAIQQKYNSEGQKMQQQVRVKYGPKMQAIQTMPGTNEQKQAKAKPILKQIIAENGLSIKSMLGRMAKEVDGILTPAQKPQFSKNKTELMTQLDSQLKAASARM